MCYMNNNWAHVIYKINALHIHIHSNNGSNKKLKKNNSDIQIMIISRLRYYTYVSASIVATSFQWKKPHLLKLYTVIWSCVYCVDCIENKKKQTNKCFISFASFKRLLYCMPLSFIRIYALTLTPLVITS